MRPRVIGVLLVFLALAAWAQPEEFRDLGFGQKPFNPNDVGLVMRALIRDNDPANTDPIYFTRIRVENLGTAKPEDIEWVEVRMESCCGRTRVLAWGKGFPLEEILLGRPAEERMVLDDCAAYLFVWVKVTAKITEGRTIRPKMVLGWAEGEKGGTLELVDGVPETLLVAGSFSAQILPGPAGGNLNPGDRFPVAEIAVEDTSDVNPWGLEVERIRIDGPAGLLWILDNGVTKLEIPAGRDFALPAPLFAALDEGKGKLTVWVEVPEAFRPREPVTVAPTLTLTLREATHAQTFRLSDPLPDRCMAAGLEILEVQVPQAGKVLSPTAAPLAYSVLTLGDQDRNATPIRLDALTLKPLGTLTSVAAVEVVDGGGRLVGFAPGMDKPIPLASPAGTPLLMPDEATWTLQVRLALRGKIPVGASLLLSHEIALEEVLPREYLARPDALTRFQGTQSVAPKAAVFFGKPTVRLTRVGEGAVLSTDGETVGLLSGKLGVRPWEFVEIGAKAVGAYRLTTSALPDGLAFSLEAGRAQAGDLAAFTAQLKPGRVPAKTVPVALDLRVERVVDWAGIALPFEVGPAQVSLSFTAPQIGLLPTPERKDAAIVHADTRLGSLRMYVRFDRDAPVELKEVRGLGPYVAEVVSEEKPEPGRILLSVVSGQNPESGALVQLIFAKKVKEEVALALRLEVLEVRGPEGTPLPFHVEPEGLELRF